MAEKNKTPSVIETAFNCPHCGAYTTQKWYFLHAKEIDENQRTPRIPSSNAIQLLKENRKMEDDRKSEFIEYIKRRQTGQVFLDKGEGSYLYFTAENLYISECFNCKKFAVWVYQSLIWPPQRSGEPPNPDLPDDIRADYEEAMSIVKLSPRGASALLRLCIQKLCKFLGESGKNIDNDIASLVAKGLNPLIQKSLDIVRVIGNESVHPGNIDLKDDVETATSLFEVINAVADQMISHPQNVDNLYKKLPVEKRKAIEKRNAKGKSGFVQPKK